jgi:hypothetical protein
MSLFVRAAAFVGALATGAAVVGCGGSVADADRRDPVRTTPPPPSPFCAAAQANLDAIRPLNGLVARGSVPPDELDRTVTAVRRAGTDMLDTAPGEIRPDVERTVQAVNLQLDALVANGGDAAALSRDPQLASRLNSPEFAGAADRVRSYVARTCTATTANPR